MVFQTALVPPPRHWRRPAGWGGYWLLADAVELWVGRPDRMHERVRHVRRGDRSAVRAAEEAVAGARGAGESAAVVSEHLGLEQLVRNRRAIHRYE